MVVLLLPVQGSLNREDRAGARLQGTERVRTYVCMGSVW